MDQWLSNTSLIVLDKKAPSHSHGYCVSSYDSGIVIPVKSYEIPQQNYHRILGSVFISVLISLLSRGAIILIYKLGARAFPHPHCLVMSVWWFLLKLFNVFWHFTRGHFWEKSHRKQFFVHTSQRTVATPGHGGPPPIIDYRSFGQQHMLQNPLLKPLGAPSRVWLHHSNLELQLGMVASICFYLDLAPWKPWPPWKKPVANKKKFILASEHVKLSSLWKEHESTRLV